MPSTVRLPNQMLYQSSAEQRIFVDVLLLASLAARSSERATSTGVGAKTGSLLGRNTPSQI